MLFLLILFSFVSSGGESAISGYSSSLNPLEQQIVSAVNGSRAYVYDLGLEKIAFENLAFRSGGSPGATEAAYWIRDQFSSFGLDASLEGFQFAAWNVLSKPSLVIDDDGNSSTTSDQVSMMSFESAHLSLPTGLEGFFADVAVLPLPPAADRSEVGINLINLTEWNAVDITGKIVLIGKEVRLSSSWMQQFTTKLSHEPPSAIVYTWWYDWMAFTPVQQGSSEGKFYSCPVGLVDYSDGLWIRNREHSLNVSARFTIDAILGTDTHYNVVGKMSGHENPEKVVIVSGHYDTVMTGGFVDNGAGVAGVLETAKVLTDSVRAGSYKPKYTIIFVAFASEEFGLVGSINYVRMHKSQMPNVIAVVNLDCIGSDELQISSTNSVGDFDLDQTLLDAAQDLSVPVALDPSGGSSDHEVFKSPWWAHELYFDWWGLDSGISDAVPVESSSIVSSVPLLYSDMWTLGAPGWIHTSYDNSTSTQTLHWAQVDDLENQIKVITLAVVRISPSLQYGAAPVASFEYSPSAPSVGVSVVLNASASYDSDGTIVLYSWDLGDNTKVNETEPVLFHVYAAAGTYNVTLTVVDDDGQTATIQASVKVYLIVHDVSVVTIAPSVTEVKVGQSVTITVAVKNEGNATESFSVVTFYNATQIGTKDVSNLTESRTVLLDFTWNTAGVSDGEYTIKAVAGPVSGETDQEDNTRTAFTNVKVNTQAQLPQPEPQRLIQLLPLVMMTIGVIALIAVAGASIYLYLRRK